jgi:uncharacterized membrane protein
MNNNTILATALLVAGTLLTATAVTTMVPSAYADNKQKAGDDSAAAIADCDENDVEEAGFNCFGIAVNDIEADIGGDLIEVLGPTLTAEDGMTTTTETP